MKNSHLLLVIALLLILGQVAKSQEVIFSKPQKLPNNITEFDMLGKTSEGILLHKWGRKTQQLEAYNPENLDLKWQRDIKLGEKNNDKYAKVIQIITYPDALILLFTTRKKKTTYLMARKTKLNLTPISEDIILDQFDRKFGQQNPEYVSKFSKNKEFISIFKKEYDINGLKKMTALLINPQLQTLGKNDFRIEDKTVLKDYFVNNMGVVFLAIAHFKRTVFSNSPRYEKLTLLEYNPTKKSTNKINISELDYLINDLTLQPDDKNNRIVIAGFYSEKQAQFSNGYFYIFIDLKTKEVSQKKFEAFSEAFVKKIRSRQVIKLKNKIDHLKINRLILRNDGGAILLGETYYQTSRNISSFAGAYSQRMDQVINYFYDDVIALSINPDGSLFWGNILQKKQYSESDDGYFSSFGVINTREHLNLVFNEDISNQANINNFMINAKGDYKIVSVFNAAVYNLMLAPRYSKQLSSSEVLVPAFNQRNQFMLTKISF